MTVIDTHSHFFPENWPDLAKRFGTPNWPWMKHLEPGRAMVMIGDEEFRPINSACWDIEHRISELDRDGIDQQVICSTPVLFAYTRDPQHAKECAEIFNDACLDMCAKSDNRLLPLCQVPLQDIDLACEEVTRCMKNGHLGVQIGNHVGDKNLDDEGIVTFLQHCANENASVLVHPWDMMAPERMPKYMLQWLVGMVAETQLAILSLCLSGAFERLPKELRILFVHGGGSFAFCLGRCDNAWHQRDIVREASAHPPSHYTDRFYLDSTVFDDAALKMLVDTVSEDRVVLGTDYPFPLGEQELGKLVRECPLITNDQRRKIMGANANAWLGR